MSAALIYANVSFAHTDDPYMTDVAFTVLPRAGDDIALVDSGGGDGSQRIDKVSRVRHYMKDDGQHIELIVDRR